VARSIVSLTLLVREYDEAIAFFTEQEVVAGMSANYCRRGAYGHIKRAVIRAAAEMATAVEPASGRGTA
jgi:aerobic-type carbon monoxide dehydrogenase small subunit (CoxS/CutS family)